MNFVNAHQTREERREKYALLLQEGFTVRMARAARDWTWSHISILIEHKRTLGVM